MATASEHLPRERSRALGRLQCDHVCVRTDRGGEDLYDVRSARRRGRGRASNSIAAAAAMLAFWLLLPSALGWIQDEA